MSYSKRALRKALELNARTYTVCTNERPLQVHSHFLFIEQPVNECPGKDDRTPWSGLPDQGQCRYIRYMGNTGTHRSGEYSNYMILVA
jgi:hypothetical protein